MDIKTKFVKPKEVSELLKLNIITVYEYIREGKLKAMKLGRGCRVAEKDLESFIQESTVKVKKK